MIRFLAISTMLLATAPTAFAASFDCSAATTPFENAICGDEALSAADERLAKTYETAIGGLSEAARRALRDGQREWLAFAQRACTEDAAPISRGTYDNNGVQCLVSVFDSRSTVLEQSRMIDGKRFYPLASYDAVEDPNEAEGSTWPVASHELAWVQMDEGAEFAPHFNALVQAEAEAITIGPEDQLDYGSTDTADTLAVEEVAGTRRITLIANTYWYGHGAAHGNPTVSYRHYLVDEGRWLEAGDVFAGKGWRAALLDLAVTAARAEHGDMLMLDDPSYIADAVADPQRWVLSDPYGLIIQFQPYEIAAYAYGAPTAKVSWEELTPYLADAFDAIRYGF